MVPVRGCDRYGQNVAQKSPARVWVPYLWHCMYALYRVWCSALIKIQCRPGNKAHFSCMIPTQYLTPQHHCSDIQQYHTCAITKTIRWIEVVKQHERVARLKSKMCQWKSGGIERVEKLYRVYVGIIMGDFIDTHMDGLFTRKPVKDGVIKLIPCIIFWQRG